MVATRIRDCLVVAFEALLILRRRNLTALRLRVSFVTVGDRFRIMFRGHDVKNGRPIDLFVPRQITEPLRDYLASVRADIHPSFEPNAVWISRRTGKAMSASGLGKIVPAMMGELFDELISTHRFRNIGMTAASRHRHAYLDLARRLAGHTASQQGERSYVAHDFENRLARKAKARWDRDIKMTLVALQTLDGDALAAIALSRFKAS